MAVNYAHVLELAKQLTPEEQTALIETLRAKQRGQVTREMLLAEFERRKATGEDKHDDLYFGKYANPSVNVSEEQLLADIHEAATEWEKELDEFYGDSPKHEG
jgi:hypothetical protein